MKKLVFLSKNKAETLRLGQILAKSILEYRDVPQPLVIGLIGELGSGKTTFAQGFAKGLGVREKVLSPTFVLMKRYPLSKEKSNFKNYIHIDLYRVGSKRELQNLGIKKIFSKSLAIILIEWAEKIKKFLPFNTVMIYFRHKYPHSRIITFTYT